MEGDTAKLLRLLGERGLAVLLPEEAGIAQACGQHLAVAGDDRHTAILRLDIGGADEGRGELARRITQNEIFLVDTQG